MTWAGFRLVTTSHCTRSTSARYQDETGTVRIIQLDHAAYEQWRVGGVVTFDASLNAEACPAFTRVH